MGVNNISHYNYSHTATPIHHQPSSNPPFTLLLPAFSICLYSQSFFLPLFYDLITPFTLLSLIHFLFLFTLGVVQFLFSNYIKINLLVSGLRSQAWVGWSESTRRRRNMTLWKLEKNTTKDCTSAFRLACCLNAATTANSNNNLGKSLELFTAMREIQSLAP